MYITFWSSIKVVYVNYYSILYVSEQITLNNIQKHVDDWTWKNPSAARL